MFRGIMPRSMWKDLALSVTVGLAFGLSPLTSAHRVLPSIVGGCVAGILFLAWRRWRATRDASIGDPEPERAPLPRLTWLILALAAVIFAPLAFHLFPYYTHSVWRNGHGLIVPLVIVSLAAGILRSGRTETDEMDEASAWGFLPLVIGLSLVILDLGIQTLHVSVLGLVFFLPGLSLLLLGVPRTKRLVVPFALCVFLLPLPSSLANLLQLPTATAAGVAWIAEWYGIPVVREGRLLGLPGTSFGVSANCSGFSALYASLALVLVLGAASRSLPRIGLLLLSVWPITVFANTLRTSALILICYEKGISFLDTPLHGISGIFAFGAIIAAVGLLAGPRALKEVMA